MNIKGLLKKTAAITLSAVLLVGCGTNADATLVDINKGEDKVTFGYGNFVAHYYQAGFDFLYRAYFGDEYWQSNMFSETTTTEEDVKEQSMEFIKDAWVSEKHAADYDVVITDEDKKKAAKAAKQFMSDNSEEAIKQMGATEEYATKLLLDQTYITRVQDKIEDAANVDVSEEDNIQSTISFVRFFNKTAADASGNQWDLSEEEIAQALASAQKVAASDDFEAAAKACDTPIMSGSFTAKDGSTDDQTIPKEVIEVAQKMSDGEISDVIDVKDNAYFVVRMDKVNDANATKNKVKELKEDAVKDEYDKVLDGWKKDLDWKVDEKLWSKITYYDLFEEKVDTPEDGANTTDAGEQAGATETTDETEE